MSIAFRQGASEGSIRVRSSSELCRLRNKPSVSMLPTSVSMLPPPSVSITPVTVSQQSCASSVTSKAAPEPAAGSSPAAFCQLGRSFHVPPKLFQTCNVSTSPFGSKSIGKTPLYSKNDPKGNLSRRQASINSARLGSQILHRQDSDTSSDAFEPVIHMCVVCPYSSTHWESVRRHAWRQHKKDLSDPFEGRM